MKHYIGVGMVAGQAFYPLPLGFDSPPLHLMKRVYYTRLSGRSALLGVIGLSFSIFRLMWRWRRIEHLPQYIIPPFVLFGHGRSLTLPHVLEKPDLMAQ